MWPKTSTFILLATVVQALPAYYSSDITFINESQIRNSTDSFTTLSKSTIDLDNDFERFYSKKDKLDNQIVLKAMKLGGDNSVIYLKNTVVVPKSTSKNLVTFEEYNIETIEQHKEGYLVPITPCMEFDGVGLSGSISFSYKLQGEHSFSLKTGGNGGYQPLNIGFDMGLHVMMSNAAYLTGSFTCNGVAGRNVRLFATTSLVDLMVHVKDHEFNKAKKTLKSGKWQSISPVQILTYSFPSFYCGSSDKMDLMCSTPDHKFEDGKLPTYMLAQNGMSSAIKNPNLDF